MSLKIFNIKWNDIYHLGRAVVPPLTYESYKGLHGRIGIVGGSPDYTGAPFYAGLSSLRFGSDLTFVFCAQQAALPIKSYSPELMVTPFYDFDKLEDESHDPDQIAKMASTVTGMFPRLHGLIIGCGLGRNEIVNKIVSIIISEAVAANLPIVIDADGLWLVSKNLSLIRGYENCILTPNGAEFDRLVSSIVTAIDDEAAKCADATAESQRLKEEMTSTDENVRIRAVGEYLKGVTIFKKGLHDVISYGREIFVIEEKGSPRRCGGQGDVLAGALGTSLVWANKRADMLPSLEMLSYVYEDGDEDIMTEEEKLKIQIEKYSMDGKNLLPSSDGDEGENPYADYALSTKERSQKLNSLGLISHEDMLKELSTLSIVGLNSPQREFQLDSRTSGEGPSVNAEEFRQDSLSGKLHPTIWACILSSVVTKRSSMLAYLTKKRSMTAPDVIDNIGEAFQNTIKDDLF